MAALRRLAFAMGTRVQLVPLAPATRPDAERAARQLSDVLELVDSLPFKPKHSPLRYPLMLRR